VSLPYVVGSTSPYNARGIKVSTLWVLGVSDWGGGLVTGSIIDSISWSASWRSRRVRECPRMSSRAGSLVRIVFKRFCVVDTPVANPPDLSFS
jgi:hypothetical protein